MATVPLAENMMDLIDGYCRLEKNTDDTVIYRPNKGMDHVVFEKGAQLDDLQRLFSVLFNLSCNHHDLFVS